MDVAGIPEELYCAICGGVFLDPQAGPCGHSFCACCLEQWLESSPSCPLCRSSLQQPDIAECSALRERCDALHVRCPWRCGWSGRRDEIVAHTTACSVGCFVDVTIAMEGPLGIGFEIIDGRLLVSALLGEDSAVRRYNEARESDEAKQIRVNDQVVQVDGIRGDLATLAYLIKRPSRRSITFRHPEELAISVAKRGRQLGIDLCWGEDGVMTVQGVVAGAVEEYNSLARCPSEQLLKHDRIIEVNGVDCLGRPDSVVPLLLESEEFTIRFHRQRLNMVCSI